MEINLLSSLKASARGARRWVNGDYVVGSHEAGTKLTDSQRFREFFRQWRKLLNEAGAEAGSPSSGMSGLTGITSSQRKAVYGSLIVMALFIILVNPNDSNSNGMAINAIIIILFSATLAPCMLLLFWWDKSSGGRVDGRTGILWLTAILITGLVSGHFAKWGLSTCCLSVVLSATEPEERELMAFTPEFLMLLFTLAGYQRFRSISQWQRALKLETLKREAAEQGQALAQAQLKLLQAQIEPHFLFNTLASVQHLVRKDPPRADFLLSQLIRYLREAMPDIRGMGSTLGREFGLVEAYLNIVRIRLDGRLEVKVSIPPELAEVSFPVLIVQTLVENAIKHGIEPKPGSVHIYVTASEATVEGKQFIDVGVSDDGVGFGVAETMGTGVGLRNIRERLAGLYGSSARLSITEVKPSGVCATVRIPRTMA